MDYLLEMRWAVVSLEGLKLTFDLRHASGCGENFPVGFCLSQLTPIACHGGRFRTEVLGGWTMNALGFQGWRVTPSDKPDPVPRE